MVLCLLLLVVVRSLLSTVDIGDADVAGDVGIGVGAVVAGCVVAIVDVVRVCVGVGGVIGVGVVVDGAGGHGVIGVGINWCDFFRCWC